MDNGSKWVDLAGKDDKRQITTCFAGKMEGDFLPAKLEYEGTVFRKSIFLMAGMLLIQVLTGAMRALCKITSMK